VAIGIDIGEALVKAHRAGIVHRDVKPDNIFVVKRQDLTTQAKLLDFGVAAMLDNLRTLRETGKLLGTPRYASPQQQRGEKAHPSMDIWALGYVLFEAMVGHGPFRGRTLEEIVVAVQSADPAFRVSDFLPDVYGPLDKLLAWMLEKEVSKRAASVEDVTEILRKISTAMLAPARPLGQDDSTVDSMLGLVHRTSPGDGKPHVAKSPSSASAEGSTTATPPFFADPPGAVARPAVDGTPRGQVPTESSLLAAGEVADAERDPQAVDRAWGFLSGEAKAISLPTPQAAPARDLTEAAPERVNSREETSPPWNRSGSIPAVTVRNGVRVAVAGAAAGVLAFVAVAGVRLVRKSPVTSSPTAESTVVRSNGEALAVTVPGLPGADRPSSVFDAGVTASSPPEPATPPPQATAALAPTGAASKTRPASQPAPPAGSVRTQSSARQPPPTSKKPSYDVF
jgi:serine/threonine-protein kinase